MAFVTSVFTFSDFSHFFAVLPFPRLFLIITGICYFACSSTSVSLHVSAHCRAFWTGNQLTIFQSRAVFAFMSGHLIAPFHWVTAPGGIDQTYRAQSHAAKCDCRCVLLNVHCDLHRLRATNKQLNEPNLT